MLESAKKVMTVIFFKFLFSTKMPLNSKGVNFLTFIFNLMLMFDKNLCEKLCNPFNGMCEGTFLKLEMVTTINKVQKGPQEWFQSTLFYSTSNRIFHDPRFLNASKYCGSVLKNDFVVVVVLVLVVADELLSNF